MLETVNMAREYSRTQRVADQMQRELAQLIQREVRDPRLGMVTVTAVEVSRDMSHAKVFITLMNRKTSRSTLRSSRMPPAICGCCLGVR